MKRPDMTLKTLLSDPLIRLVMASDGVEDDDILALARRYRAHDDRRPAAPTRRWAAEQGCCMGL